MQMKTEDQQKDVAHATACINAIAAIDNTTDPMALIDQLTPDDADDVIDEIAASISGKSGAELDAAIKRATAKLAARWLLAITEGT